VLHLVPEELENLQRRAAELRAASDYVGAAVARLQRDVAAIDSIQRLSAGENVGYLCGVGQ
jgi:hypothetical protein